MIYNALNAEDTIRLGEEFGKTLKSGDIVCLTGDLGAGKTTFTKGIAKALECIYEPVSPTFNIVNEYPGKTSVYHFDSIISKRIMRSSYHYSAIKIILLYNIRDAWRCCNVKHIRISS